jgi:ADP-ribose pyrophosphatase
MTEEGAGPGREDRACSPQDAATRVDPPPSPRDPGGMEISRGPGGKKAKVAPKRGELAGSSAAKPQGSAPPLALDDARARAVIGDPTSARPVRSRRGREAATALRAMKSGAAVRTHVKARTERPDIYPERAAVPDHAVAWDVPLPGYAPSDFRADTVRKNIGVWADPDDVRAVRRAFQSSVGPVRTDDRGRPLNPMGRTGVEGTGLLGRWGANRAADPIVTRISEKTGLLEIILIRREDSGEWALPGGMVDPGEKISKTLARELKEETAGVLDMSDARVVYEGYVDDRRNTDNAWMETTAAHKHLSAEDGAKIKLRRGSDATEARWTALSADVLDHLYADHGRFVKAALKGMLVAGGASLPPPVRRQLRALLAE